MNNPTVSNPNDFKVVEFYNSTDFDFTPEMGCMYDSRPISGISGAPGIVAGESITLPYHIGNQLAKNLAKAALVRGAPAKDKEGIPTGVPLWDESGLKALQSSYLKELYVDAKPAAQSETDILFARMEELQKTVASLQGGAPAPEVVPPSSTGGYKDKAEVIAELEVRAIPHDKRKSKAELEKLLTPVA